MGQRLTDLAEPFEALGKEAWRKKVEDDFRGGDTDTESLRKTDANGDFIEALYTIEDSVDAGRRGLPGQSPHVRGSVAQGGWTLRQEFSDCRINVSNEQILADLRAGVEALWLRVRMDDGIQVISSANFDALLDGVDLQSVSVCLDPGSEALTTAAAYIASLQRRGGAEAIDFQSLRGGLGADPLGTLAKSGGLPGGRNQQYEHAVALAQWCTKKAPGLRAMLVDTRVYHEAGASEVQELAYAIATGVVYLRKLVEAGMNVDAAAQQIAFSICVSDDFFSELAKLRAARWLWSRVVTASGGEESSAAMWMHCRTSGFSASERDPWVNMLRATNQTAAAALGGANSIATTPFDSVIGPANELSRRVARNTQIVLRDESHLAHVVDAAGGSWYIEQRTDDLANKAWALFQEIESNGGFETELTLGRVTEAVTSVAERRRTLLAKRKTSVVGVNEFANLDETLPVREAINVQETTNALRDSLQQSDPPSHQDRWVELSDFSKSAKNRPVELVQQCIEIAKEGGDTLTMASVLRDGLPDFHIEPIRSWRLAEDYEALRGASDQHVALHGHRPRAFMANLGPIPEHKTRSAWSTNLLAAGGIEALPNDGYPSVEAIVAAWGESEADMAVICGTDDRYAEQAFSVATALAENGCSTILLAGKPGDKADAYNEAGVSMFIYAGAGCDVLQTLNQVHDQIGVGR